MNDIINRSPANPNVQVNFWGRFPVYIHHRFFSEGTGGLVVIDLPSVYIT